MTVNLITLTEPRSAAAEAYRALRTNIMFSSVEKPITTLLVTSAAASEDKSIAVANLAVTLAQSGSRTILVDADLRRPAQHTIWGIDNSRGLSAMMLDDSTLASPPLIATSVDNLSVLPSGALPPVPSDVLSSQRMTEIIGVLKARASFILFDAPPVLAATDATILGAKVDAAVLVARAGAARRDQLARASQTLKRVNVRLLGVVLTNAPREMKAY
jgi:capsular exopolysaccharide synthesis family protein